MWPTARNGVTRSRLGRDADLQLSDVRIHTGAIPYGRQKRAVQRVQEQPRRRAVGDPRSHWRPGHVLPTSTFVETPEAHTPDGNVGELRFSYSHRGGQRRRPLTPISRARTPPPAMSGSVRVNFNTDGGGIPLGSYDFLTILHEIGHALGLKHPFDAAPERRPGCAGQLFLFDHELHGLALFGAPGQLRVIPSDHADVLRSAGDPGACTASAPTHTGNTIYTFNDGITLLAGHQRYRRLRHHRLQRRREAVSISLNPGAFSTLSEAIIPSSMAAHSKGTVTIGPNVVIEAARGGSGNDILTGNTASNSLIGAAGNDLPARHLPATTR